MGRIDEDGPAIQDVVLEPDHSVLSVLFSFHGDEAISLAAVLLLLLVEDDLGVQDQAKLAEELDQVVLSGMKRLEQRLGEKIYHT